MDELATLTRTVGAAVPQEKYTMKGLENLVRKEAFANVKQQDRGKINLKLKTKEELEEMLMKQEKMLSNKSLVSKLPDKGERIKTSVKDVQEELESRAAPTGDIVDLLQNLEIVEKRPTNAFIKKKEAEKAQSESPKKFHAHRNEAYEKKNGKENQVQTLTIDESRTVCDMNKERERVWLKERELQKMKEGFKIPLIIQDSTGWRDRKDSQSSDDSDDDQRLSEEDNENE